MNIKIIRRMEVDLDGAEFNVLIHALQSHCRYGQGDWPSDGDMAAEMRDLLMNAELSDRNNF